VGDVMRFKTRDIHVQNNPSSTHKRTHRGQRTHRHEDEAVAFRRVRGGRSRGRM